MYCKSMVPGFRMSISELVSNVLFYGSINLLTGVCNKYVHCSASSPFLKGRTLRTFQYKSEKFENIMECDVY